MKLAHRGSNRTTRHPDSGNKAQTPFEKLPGRKSHASTDARAQADGDAFATRRMQRAGLAIGVILLVILGVGAWLILAGMV